jgi:hypothetical protein
MRRFGFGLLFGVAGYLIVAVAGYFLISQFSSNTHDRSVEAAMTSIFFFGPIGAVLGFILGVIRGGRRPSVPPTDDS